MNKLSVVIITFNEEKNIERCLKSVKDISDQIVVIDSFSTDKTEEICKTYKVDFFQHKFEGYSEQKNIANSYAKFDYIFSIDADEELSEILKQSIIFAKNNTEFAAYNLNRLNNYIGKWIHYGIWNPDKKLRLWNKNDAKWSGLIHESVVFNKQVKVGFLKGELLHYSYYSIDQHIKQTDKFTSLSAQEMFSRKKKVNNSKIFFSTFFTFFKGFFIKLAFLDGYYGIIICLIVSFSTFIKYVKLKELYKKENLIKSI